MASNPKTPESPGSDRVAQFPPLPSIPLAPQLPPDARQATVDRIVGGLADAVSAEMHVTGPNLTHGFYAASVDLGRLQAELSQGIQRLSPDQIEERWDEVLRWIHGFLRSWVQRCKRMSVERRELGIRVELETQDDNGYYNYGFDVLYRKSG